MKPAVSERDMTKRGMTKRQAARRQIKPEDLGHKTVEHKPGATIATFGKKSKVIKDIGATLLRIPDDDLHNIGLEDLQHVIELIKSLGGDTSYTFISLPLN